MVLIFVLPQAQHHGEPEEAGEPGDVCQAGASWVKNPTTLDYNFPGAENLQVRGLAEASVIGPRSTSSMTLKRRRSRGHGRKPVRTGPEPAVVSAPAAWIRIGPGKFVRADSQVQGHPLPLVTHANATFEPTETLTKAEVDLPDPVEETNPVSLSTAVYAPTWADFNKPGPNPEHDAPFQELAATASPEPGSLTIAPELKADMAWQESNFTTAPVTIAINGGWLPDSIIAEPGTEEYGIAPSTFSPSLLAASLEEGDLVRGWTDLPDSTRTGVVTSADAGNGDGNGYGWKLLKQRSSMATAWSCLTRRERPLRFFQNVRSEGRRQGSAGLRRATRYAARASVRRNFSCSSRVYRGYQPRSPPAS